jgi:AcrR family transcriptional regulator
MMAVRPSAPELWSTVQDPVLAFGDSLNLGSGDRMPRIAAKDRREALIAAAIRVMAREGVIKATTRAIVAEADMPLGVFHYCFNSREELLQEVITRLTDSTVAAARQALAGESDLSSSIAKSLHAFWMGVELNPDEQLVGYELTHYTLRQPGLEGLARRQYAHYLEALKEFLADAAENTGIQWTVPIPVLARYLYSVLDGLALSWIVDRDSEQSLEVLRITGEHLLTLASKPAPSED